ncbi:MAG: choice-of-anchor A family protein [Phycisphaeraceae bacterium]|nr:choice-of-anchor A family protein [Phycisphaeraceae bacterium]
MSRLCSKVVSALAVACAMTMSASANVLYDWNLVVLGNLSSTSEVGGRAFIGGNLGGSASNWAYQLNPAVNWLGIDTLVVGGNITASNLNIQAGNLRLGGSSSANLNFNGGGSLILDPTVSSQIPGIAAQLTATSSALAALTTNSTVVTPGGQPGAAVFNANPVNGVAVFSVAASSLFSNGLVQQIELNANGASSIVVNVTGQNVLYNSGNFVGAFTSNFARANVIWNFVDATDINLQRGFNGAILAPNAHLTNINDIDGSVFVGSFSQFGEVHLPNYTGVIPAPGAALLLTAAGVLAGRRRRAA